MRNLFFVLNKNAKKFGKREYSFFPKTVFAFKCTVLPKIIEIFGIEAVDDLPQ